MSRRFSNRSNLVSSLALTLLPALVSASNEFNPDLSLILSGGYNDYQTEAYELPGFPLGGEAGLAEKGLTLGHSELVLSANVDDRFYGFMTTALHQLPDATEVALEEAYIETQGLEGGVTIKAGRFLSELGYLNSQHNHVWDFADAPLIYRGLFGDNLRDNGLQLRWLAPSDLYLELGGELLRGEGFPASPESADGQAASTLFAKLGGDLGDNQSWQLGLAHWQASVVDRSGGGHGHGVVTTESPLFSGDSVVSAIDLVWRWTPDSGGPAGSWKLQLEYMQREESGILDDGSSRADYSGSQSGWYAQWVYQLNRQWRAGLRYDQLQANNRSADAALLLAAGLDDEEHQPSRSSLMVDYARSEQSRIRLQYNRDDSTPISDDQFMLQYQVSLGAHGAHGF